MGIKTYRKVYIRQRKIKIEKKDKKKVIKVIDNKNVQRKV